MGNASGGLCRAGLALLILLLVRAPAGAETVVTPTVSVRAEYDDNTRFTVQDPVDDLVSSLRAGLEAVHTTERMETNAAMSLRAFKYMQDSDRDREEGRVEAGLSYALTERWSAGGNASYSLDSALESELLETGLVTEQSERVRLSAGGRLNFRLTELQELGLSVSLGRTEYDSDSFVDYDTSSVTLTWYRAFRNQRDGLTVQPYWSGQSTDTSEAATWGLMVGWTREWTEQWRLNAFLGGRRTTTETRYVRPQWVFDPDLLPAFPFVLEEETVTEEAEGWGGVADVSLTWTGETWSAAASYNRDLSYDSLGEPIEQDRLSLSVTARWDERLRASCTGAVSFTRRDTQIDDEGSRSFSLAPTVSYRLTADHWLNAGVVYDAYEEEGTGDSGRDRKRVWVSLEWRFPRAW